MAEIDTPTPNLRERVRIIIHEADTPAGKTFDVALILCILASVAVVMMITVPSLKLWHDTLFAIEWGFTILFTIEYSLRLCSRDTSGAWPAGRAPCWPHNCLAIFCFRARQHRAGTRPVDILCRA
jgi:hypothetical protein